MSNWSVLKAAVSDAIKANGNQEITGAVLQETLLNIVSSVGQHAAFAGIATPTTRPGTYDGPTFYIAITPGTYPNFGSARVAEGRLGIFYTTVDNSSWQLGSILVTAPLSDGSITTDKLEDGAVTRDKLALNSVDTTELCNGAVTQQKLAAAVQAMLMNADEKKLLQYYDRVRDAYLQILNGRDIQYDRDEVMLGRTYTGSLDDLDNEAIYLEAATPDQAGVMSADDKEALDGLVALIESDHDGVINKFNEIVEFLKGIQDTDTLQSILSGISSQITHVRNNALGPTVKAQFTANNGALKFYTVTADTDGPADTTVSLPAATKNAAGLMSADNANLLTALNKLPVQFKNSGRYINANNGASVNNANYSTTQLIPINRNFSILVKVRSDLDDVAVLAYYDAAGTFIKGLARSGFGVIQYIATPSEIPSNAVYFTVSALNGYEKSYTNTDDTFESYLSAISSNQIGLAKEQLFIDIWKEVVSNCGTYDPAHDPDTGKNYKLNDLWFSYTEAKDIFAVFLRMSSYIGVSLNAWSCAYGFKPIKTNIPIIVRDTSGIKLDWGYGDIKIDKFRINYNDAWTTHILSAAYVVNCIEITTPISIVASTGNVKGFADMPRLEEINLTLSTNKNLSFAKSANLSLTSLQKYVNQATNTEAVTFTVHADVYAKLTNEANTEWHKVLTDAEAKNIQFVSA